jgi:hypothetical protein
MSHHLFRLNHVGRHHFADALVVEDDINLTALVGMANSMAMLVAFATTAIVSSLRFEGCHFLQKGPAQRRVLIGSEWCHAGREENAPEVGMCICEESNRHSELQRLD